MKRLLLILVLTIPAYAQETINWMTIYSGGGGFSMIPSETRNFYIQQTNTTIIGANFSIVSGGGSIVSSLNGLVTYQAPASGSTCGLNSTQTTSAITVTLRATPKDGGAAAVDLPIAICNPSVRLNNIPSFRLGVYANQPVDVQSVLWGSVDKAVTWAITTQPGGGNGTLADNTNGDTVFTASVAGRYIITSTSHSDVTKTATTIIDVTGHSLPYNVTADGTEPVDCSTDPSLTGTIYIIGPGKTYADFTALFNAVTLAAGDTILYENQDLTGTSPTTLFNYIAIPTIATQSQPLFFCGKPDSTGHLPVLDATNSTSNYPANQFISGTAHVLIYQAGFGYYPTTPYPQFIQLSGFSLNNANSTLNYYVDGNSNHTLTPWGTLPNGTNSVLMPTGTTTSGSTAITGVSSIAGVSNDSTINGAGITRGTRVASTSAGTINLSAPATASGTVTLNVWNSGPPSAFIAAIRIQNGSDINIIGNAANNNGISIFSEAKRPNGAMTYNLLAEGNRFKNYGLGNNSAETGGVHGFYVQNFGEVFQFNNVGPAASTATGGTYKDRGVAQWVRYNYFNGNDTTTRNIDLVDQQDSAYTSVSQFYGNGDPANDTAMTADILTANYESFLNQSWFYGNTHVTLSAYGPIHFCCDHGTNGTNRGGQLHYYNNTLYHLGTFAGVMDNKNPIDSGPPFLTPEFPSVFALNSIMWMDGTGTATALAFISDRSNRISREKWITPSACCNNDYINGSHQGYLTGWPDPEIPPPLYYSDSNNLPAHISGFGTSGSPVPNSVATRPFNTSTFVSSPIAGDVLPASLASQPVRFMFLPANGYAVPRTYPVTGSQAGVVGSVDSPFSTPALTINGNIKIKGSVIIR